MRTRSSLNLVGESSPNPTTSNPKRRTVDVQSNLFSLEESPPIVGSKKNSLVLFSLKNDKYPNEISNFQQHFDESFHEALDRYKDLLRACPHHGFTELHQLDTFYNALNPADQDSLNSAAGGNLLERLKSSDGNSSSSDIAKLTHAVNQQTSVVTTVMTAILKQFQATPPPAS
ncbi:reverse transcriptase domain-containing protein, partial [Tanacetum coccineum]